MPRPTRSFAVLVLSLTVLGMLAAPTLAAPGGNSAASAACTNGGYANYTRQDGSTFKNEGQCTKYEAQGNALVLTPVARCKQEAAAAGITDTSGYTIIAGSDGDDYSFTLTAGPDLICGFGGEEDYVETLDAGDVFLGGAGSDGVGYVYGTFLGGDGDDWAYEVYGTFNGGAGNDTTQTVPYGGTFIQ